VTNVLMVTTSVWMLDGVHCHTSHNWPAVTLRLVLVVRTTSLQHWLIDTSTASNDTDLTTSIGLNDLLGARWQSETSLIGIWVVRDNRAIITRCAGNSTTVTWSLLNVGDDGTLWHRAEWKNVPIFKAALRPQ